MIACPTCRSPHTRGPLQPRVALGWYDAHRCVRAHLFHLPLRTGYCQHCTRERDDLELHELDGRQYWMCSECREAPVRGSSYHWDGPETPSRSARINGNRWAGRHGG